MCVSWMFKCITLNFTNRFKFSSCIMEKIRYFLLCLLFKAKCIYGLTPAIFATKEGILGPSDVQLKCIYTKTATEKVFVISIQAEISSEFKRIADFFPPDQDLDARLSVEGETLLSNRVTLANPAGTPSNGQYEAIITYNETTCEDERWYRCQVQYFDGSVNLFPYSQNTTIVVKGKPSAPDTAPTFVPPFGIEEGMTVNFTCTGNVGNPAGKIFWTKFRGSTPYPQSAVTTTTQVVQGTCTSNGTSILSVQVQAEDNNAVFRCTVEQELAESNMYQQTQPEDFNVYYNVRNIVASKPAGAPPSYAEGAPPITLTCSAEGNPPLSPNDYTWYNETDMETPLGTGTMYTIQNVIVNQTGNYVCVGRNSFNGKNYNASDTVHIQIDYTTPSPTTSGLISTSTKTVFGSKSTATDYTTSSPATFGLTLTSTKTVLDSKSTATDSKSTESILIGVVVFLILVQLCEILIFFLMYSTGKITIRPRKEKVYEDTKESRHERHVYSTMNRAQETSDQHYMDL